MRCVYCEHIESKVLDSRSLEDGGVIRRRRECLKCARRFTTKEIIENAPIFVVKSDKTRELFDVNKIKSGVMRACQKRPISLEQIDTLAENVARKIISQMDKEIKTSAIGEFVMDELKAIDDVAYVRFASVYRKFTDATTFVKFIKGK
ncbi:MAG: transcriptional regulator NrdR [Firmicutes bacterium]|nr:transcriptional regulator NrdR [Bacillota bacterium]